MKKTINTMIFGLCILTFMLNTTSGFAQHAYFVESGKIEFEKKVNMFAKLKDRTKSSTFGEKIYEEYRKSQPQFVTSKSTLSFSLEKSVYKFEEQENQQMGFFSDPWLMVKNTVYRNFKTDSLVSVRNVYGEEFVVTDKKQDVLWKLTNETREIAGYQCRRANGLIRDSIYVVAFYADEIVPSGGPESFSGLPGMILGLALPHENITFFATKVELTKPELNGPIAAPRRAKKISGTEYEDYLKKAMKNWGEWRIDAFKAFVL